MILTSRRHVWKLQKLMGGQTGVRRRKPSMTTAVKLCHCFLHWTLNHMHSTLNRRMLLTQAVSSREPCTCQSSSHLRRVNINHKRCWSGKYMILKSPPVRDWTSRQLELLLTLRPIRTSHPRPLQYLTCCRHYCQTRSWLNSKSPGGTWMGLMHCRAPSVPASLADAGSDASWLPPLALKSTGSPSAVEPSSLQPAILAKGPEG
ncbi:hypothetical protein J3F83DRAFT_697995 [Trichoderma novae-zelandiae]